MDRMKIAAIFADQEQLGGKEITVCGWARTIRDMKTFGFIELNDGSCFRNLQVVMSADELHNYKEIASQNVGAALISHGAAPGSTSSSLNGSVMALPPSAYIHMTGKCLPKPAETRQSYILKCAWLKRPYAFIVSCLNASVTHNLHIQPHKLKVLTG